MRRAIVTGLERACGVLDNVPGIRRSNDESWRSLRFYRHSCFGCHPLGLANLSLRLDERWGTEVWGPRPEGSQARTD